ncbi:MAG: preprotein translocase subunit SecE [Tessaracoccus sp.]
MSDESPDSDKSTDEGRQPDAGGPIVRKTAKAPVKKDAPTRKRSEAEREHEDVDPYAARNPAEFVRQSAGELKQVVWPTWPELVTYFFAVLIFVLFIITFVGLLDMGLGWGLLQLLGLLGTN